MGMEHLPADISSAEEGGQMMLGKETKETKVFVNHQEQGLKKVCSIKVPLLLFLIVVAVLLLVIVIILLTARTRQKVTSEKPDSATQVRSRPSPTLAPQPAATDWCTGDWILNRGNCYYFSDIEHTWIKSRDFCLHNSSTLVIIDNEQELKFLMHFKGHENHWIGLSSKEDNSGWVWVDGTSYHENIFKIKRLSASGYLEHAFLNDDGVKSESNHYDKRFICMKKQKGLF